MASLYYLLYTFCVDDNELPLEPPNKIIQNLSNTSLLEVIMSLDNGEGVGNILDHFNSYEVLKHSLIIKFIFCCRSMT